MMMIRWPKRLPRLSGPIQLKVWGLVWGQPIVEK